MKWNDKLKGHCLYWGETGPASTSIGSSSKQRYEYCLGNIWLNLQTTCLPNKLSFSSQASSALSCKSSSYRFPFKKATRLQAYSGIMPHVNVLGFGLLAPSSLSKTAVSGKKKKRLQTVEQFLEFKELSVIRFWNIRNFEMYCAVTFLQFNDFKG